MKRIPHLVVAAVVLAALLLVGRAHGAERAAEATGGVAVQITAVNAGEGFYVVALTVGTAKKVAVIVPPRQAPALTVGAAMLDGQTLTQHGARYTVRSLVKARSR